MAEAAKKGSKSKSETKSNKAAGAHRADVPSPTVEKLLNNLPEWLLAKIPEGERDQTIFRLGCYWRGQGGEEKEIGDALIEIDEERCTDKSGIKSDPTGEKVCREKARSACRYPRGRVRRAFKGTKRERAIKLAEHHVLEWWHDGGEAYATVYLGEGRVDHIRLDGADAGPFRRWLARQFYEQTAQTLNANEISDALQVLHYMAERGPERRVHVRVGGTDERDVIYLDLCDEERRVVEVTASGWRIIVGGECPLRFRRPRNAYALPLPVGSGNLTELLPQVVRCDQRSLVRLVAFLLCALNPWIPYFVLALIGPEGTAKTSLTKLLRRLVDPRKTETQQGKTVEDVAIAGGECWLVALENRSAISNDLSDVLCCISTGLGWSKRQLYKDYELAELQVRRPVVINSIAEVIARPDLMDRTLFFRTQPIPAMERMEEDVFDARVEELRPWILGALLDASARGLAELSGYRPKQLPRMASAARWVGACEAALPWEQGTFLEQHLADRATLAEDVVESDPIGTSLMQKMQKRSEWIVRGEDAVSKLVPLYGIQISAKVRPSTPRRLANWLRRIEESLRRCGIEVDFDHRVGPKDHRVRCWRFSWSSGHTPKGAKPLDQASPKPPGSPMQERPAGVSFFNRARDTGT